MSCCRGRVCTAAGTLKGSRALQRENQLTKHFMAVRLLMGAGLGGMLCAASTQHCAKLGRVLV